MSEPRYQRVPEVLETVVSDELVLLSPELRFLSLNESAAVIWARLADPSTIAEVADALTAAFDVDEPTAVEAAEQVVAALVSSGSVRQA